MGVLHEQRRIDRIHLSHPLGNLVKAVFTTPVRGSERTTVITKVCPTLPSKSSNIWRFPSYLLHNDTFHSRMQSIFQEARGLHGAVWWEQAKVLAQDTAKYTRGWTRGILQRELATLSTEGLCSDAVHILHDMGVDNPSPITGFHKLPRAVQEGNSEIQDVERRDLLRKSLTPSPELPETKTEFKETKTEFRH